MMFRKEILLMKKITVLISFLAIATAYFGCAVTTSRTFSVSAKESRVFTAAQQAMTESGFGITQSNKAEGFLSGSQGVVMGKHSTVMNVITKKDGVGSKVSVSVVPPPGMVGDTSAIVEEFEKSLRNSLSSSQM
jgi:tryptophan synthase alpha subunit